MSASDVQTNTMPPALQVGDTLGIIAPASPFDLQLFDAGVRVLESLGFNLLIHKDIYEKKGYLAGSDRHRANHLMRLFDDPEIDGIICARGGYGAMRILSLLDEERIASHPKVFVGFSDITALLSFLSERCGLVCFHGPTVTTLGKGDLSTQRHFFSAVTSPVPTSISATPARVIQPGEAQGKFLCGNLTLFCHLTGTPFQPNFAGAVLLLEDQGEAPYRIDRMLTHMQLAGCFDRIAGIALGTFHNCGTGHEVFSVAAEILGDLDIPVVAGFEVGHTDVNWTVPVGATARLESGSGVLTFDAPAIPKKG